MAQAPQRPGRKGGFPPIRELWQIPGIVAAVVIFLLAAYIARSPVHRPVSQEADFEALLMAYKEGSTLKSSESAERFLARYPGSDNEAMARFIFADSRWDLIAGDPAAVIKDLTLCLETYQRALALGLPGEYEARALEGRGDILLRMDLPNDALEAYATLAQRFPDRTSAILSLALAHTLTKPASLGKAAELIDGYLSTEGLTPRQIQKGYLAKARLDMARENYGEADGNARRVLEAGPDGEIVAQASLILSQALLAQGDLKGALAAVEDAAGFEAGRFEAALALARAIALARGGMADEARPAYDETIFRFPGTAEALGAKYHMASLLFDTGQIDAAKDALISLLDDMSAQETIRTPYFDVDDVAQLWFAVGRTILQREGPGAVHDFHKGLVLMSEGHLLYFDATLYLREAEQEETNLPGLPSSQQPAATARIEGAYLKAGGIFARVLETASGDIYREALFEAGHSFFMAGEYSPAIHYLREFTNADRHDRRVPKALYEITEALTAMGSNWSALKTCADNVESHPSNIYAYRSLLLQGDLYRSMGGDSLNDAVSIYGGILTDMRFRTESKEWRRAIFALGETLYALGRWEDAVLRLEEALERFPGDALAGEGRYYLALSYRQAGLASDGARREFLTRAGELFSLIAAAEARTDQTRAREAAFLQADCHYDLGDYGRALTLYDRAAEAHVDTPAATRALFQIANCYHHLGLPEKAAVTYKRAMFNLRRQKGDLAPGQQFYESLARWRAGGDADDA